MGLICPQIGQLHLQAAQTPDTRPYPASSKHALLPDIRSRSTEASGQLRERRIRKSTVAEIGPLGGDWRAEHLWVLGQARNGVRYGLEQVRLHRNPQLRAGCNYVRAY